MRILEFKRKGADPDLSLLGREVGVKAEALMVGLEQRLPLALRLRSELGFGLPSITSYESSPTSLRFEMSEPDAEDSQTTETLELGADYREGLGVFNGVVKIRRSSVSHDGTTFRESYYNSLTAIEEAELFLSKHFPESPNTTTQKSRQVA